MAERVVFKPIWDTALLSAGMSFSACDPAFDAAFSDTMG